MSSDSGNSGKAIRAAAIVAAVCVALVAGAIFALTEQAPDVTSAESGFVNDVLVGLFGGIPGVYDAERELWLGIHVRHWAHVAEFGALGLFVALSVLFARWGKSLAVTGALSLVVCLALSLFDQCHKLFVPGRHFDWFDLVMDAFGYGAAVLAVVAVAGIASTMAKSRPE